MTDHYLTDRLRALFDAGYHPIPIAPGTKYPKGIRGWQKANGVKPETIDKWLTEYPDWGVGILTCNTPAIDIDVLDADIAAELLEYAGDLIGHCPPLHRIGSPPKALIPCRFDGEPFRKVQSAAFEDAFGVRHRLEVLGVGQQFVAYATHPGTGEPYRWVDPTDNDRHPANLPHDQLPMLSYADAVQIVEHFEHIAAREGWGLVSRDDSFGAQGRERQQLEGADDASREEIENAMALDALRPKVDKTAAELAEMLTLIDATAHDRWVKVGMALWHQFDGDPEGFAVWDTWSQTADNYQPDVMRARWDSFRAGTYTAPVTCAYVIKLWNDERQRLKYQRLDHWMKELDAIPAGDRETLRDTVAPAIAKDTLIDDILREELAQKLCRTYKRVTDTSLPIAKARELIAPPVVRTTAAPGSDRARELFPWCEGWVYVANGDRFFNLAGKDLITVRAFNARFNREITDHPAIDRGDNDAARYRPIVLASDIALNFVKVPCVSNVMYLPGADDLFEFEGSPCANLWRAPDIAAIVDSIAPGDAGLASFSDEEQAALTTILEHFAVIVPDNDDRRTVLDFLAHRVQNPAVKCIWGLVMQGVGGDGKTFVHRLMAAVLGAHNVRTLNAFELEDKFTGWSEGSQMVFIEEIKLHGHNRFDVINRLKPLIANQVVSVRRMQTDSYQAPNVVDYVAFTNFKDGIPITDEATRRRFFFTFSALQTPAQLERFKAARPDYFDRLYDALAVGAGIVRWWFMTRELAAEFNPLGVAPDSAARREVVELSKCEDLMALEDWLDNQREPDGSLPQWVTTAAAASVLAAAGLTVGDRQLGRLLGDLGYRYWARVRVGNGSKVRAWVHESVFEAAAVEGRGFPDARLREAVKAHHDSVAADFA